MKLLLPLLVTSTALATQPRISPIVPFVGELNGTPELIDLDGDGDLDLAYLHNELDYGVIPWIEKLETENHLPPKIFAYRPGPGEEGFTDTNADGQLEFIKITRNNPNFHDYRVSLCDPLVDGPSHFEDVGTFNGYTPQIVSLTNTKDSQIGHLYNHPQPTV